MLNDSEMDQARHAVLEKLGATAVSVDELIDQCNLPAGAVMSILLELELAGRLRRNAGNKVYLMEIAEEISREIENA